HAYSHRSEVSTRPDCLADRRKGLHLLLGRSIIGCNVHGKVESPRHALAGPCSAPIHGRLHYVLRRTAFSSPRTRARNSSQAIHACLRSRPSAVGISDQYRLRGRRHFSVDPKNGTFGSDVAGSFYHWNGVDLFRAIHDPEWWWRGRAEPSAR